MDTLQILCALRDLSSFAEVFLSDLLPHSIAHACTVIINADPQTGKGSHWVAVQFQPKSSSAYYFDSYGMPPTLVPAIHEFIRRNCAGWDYNSGQPDQHRLRQVRLPVRPLRGPGVRPAPDRRTLGRRGSSDRTGLPRRLRTAAPCETLR